MYRTTPPNPSKPDRLNPQPKPIHPPHTVYFYGCLVAAALRDPNDAMAEVSYQF